MSKKANQIFWVAILVMGTGVCTVTQAFGQLRPSDPIASRETVLLFQNLERLRMRGVMFGHQDDLAYGVNWKYEAGRSDIHDVTGDYPAVYGWELGHLEVDSPANLDQVPFNKMRELIGEGYRRGGVITISWHLNNPLNGKSAWVPDPETVSSILPGGTRHSLFKSWLDKLADFLSSLKGDQGEYIPVIFRPFHEWNGSWFWWGKNHCTPEQFKSLWRFVVSYLREEKKIHHLLYAFNTDRFANREEYLERYPGNEWVDVLGFDIYQRNTPKQEYMQVLDRSFSDLEQMASERNKIPALTEFGGNLADPGWWSGTFLPVLKKHHVSYVLGWRNAGKHPNGQMEFYVPYRGQATEENFRTFYRDPYTLFQAAVGAADLYGRKGVTSYVRPRNMNPDMKKD